ncbi:hypothetical protein QYM36_008826 [Artemia franciscana]|uniref:Uncharacterized protein n=1 Tax=Artemia franciscana TaxID=6661 RepID=A0AA88L671_ARTSF|nr:hypothetical protein QYM36_008826 [Artemia franciscana]
MSPITTRTIQTIARTTDEKKYENSADESENQLRKSNHDGHDNIDSNVKKDEGIEDENLMIFDHVRSQSDHAGMTTAESNQLQFEASETKQTDQKRDENKKIQEGIKYKKTRRRKNRKRQSHHAGKTTTSSNHPTYTGTTTACTNGDETKDLNKKDDGIDILSSLPIIIAGSFVGVLCYLLFVGLCKLVFLILDAKGY